MRDDPFSGSRFVVDGELVADYAQKRGCDPLEVVEMFRARQVNLRKCANPDDAGIQGCVATVKRDANDVEYGVPIDVHMRKDGSVVLEFHDHEHSLVEIDVDDLVLDALWFLELEDE